MYVNSLNDRPVDGDVPVARQLRKYIEPLFKVSLLLFVYCLLIAAYIHTGV